MANCPPLSRFALAEFSLLCADAAGGFQFAAQALGLLKTSTEASLLAWPALTACSAPDHPRLGLALRPGAAFPGRLCCFF